MKILVQETPFDSVEDVVARIPLASVEMRDIPRIFQNVITPCGKEVV
ncbi:hypothetical protein AVEN_26841-1, partial [Araneus ventricosus]